METVATTALNSGVASLAGGMDWGAALTNAALGGLNSLTNAQAVERAKSATTQAQDFAIQSALLEAQATEDEARSNADQVWKETQQGMADLRKEQQRKRAQRTASMGQSGVLLTSGSPLAVQEGAAFKDALDTAELEQLGKDKEKDILRAGALSANKLRAKTASAYGNYSQALDLLSQGAGIYGK